MLIEIVSFFFFIFNIFLIILVVMQKNYGGFWSGPAGNDSVLLFGGNQGAGILQKITWFFGIVLILGSLWLSVYEARISQVSMFYSKTEEVRKKEEPKTTEEHKESITEKTE
jgi:protein translocase SecG subunit